MRYATTEGITTTNNVRPTPLTNITYFTAITCYEAIASISKSFTQFATYKKMQDNLQMRKLSYYLHYLYLSMYLLTPRIDHYR